MSAASKKQTRAMQARKLVRKLRPDVRRSKCSKFVIHHIDCNPLNNNPENLMLMTTHQHGRLHGKRTKGYRYNRERHQRVHLCIDQGALCRNGKPHLKTNEDFNEVTCKFCLFIIGKVRTNWYTVRSINQTKGDQKCQKSSK